MAIVVTQQPTTQIVLEGNTASFYSTASGATGVQWYATPAGTTGPYSSIPGATSTVYTTAAVGVTGNNSSVYRATFTNGVDTPVWSDIAWLYVVAPYVGNGEGYGSGSYGGQLYKYEGLGADKLHYNVLKKLWPIKELDGDTVYEADTTIDGNYLDQAYAEAQALLRECFPDQSERLIANWERVYGLVNTGDLTTRQARVVAAMIAKGGISKAYYIALATAYSLTVTITEGTALNFIIGSAPPASQLPHKVFDPDVKFLIAVNKTAGTAANYAAFQVTMDDLIPPWAYTQYT